MDTVKCACGCGQSRPRFDKKGRERFFVRGHENRQKTDAQRAAATATVNRVRPVVPWNKGKTYVHERKRVYANKGAWNKALRRLFPDKCMRCGWGEASCDTHHIVPRSNGGEYTLENGVILCPNCHRLADFGIVGVDELRRLRGV